MTIPISEQAAGDDPSSGYRMPQVEGKGPETTANRSIDPGIPVNPGAAQRLFWTVVIWVLVSAVLPLIPYHPQRVHSIAEYLTRLTLFHYLPSLPFLILQIITGLRIVQMRWPLKANIRIIIASLLIWIGLLPLDVIVHTHHGRLFTSLSFITPILFNLTLTFGFSCLGAILSRIVREPNVLLPVSFVAMPIDYVGAMTTVGFTHTVVAAHPHAVSQVMVHVPHLSGLSLENMIGPGDVLFIAFFFAAIDRLGMNLRGTLWWMSILLALTLLVVTDFGLSVAALVPMGIAVIGANFRLFKLKREEVFAMIYAALVVFAVVGVFYYSAHKMLAK